MKYLSLLLLILLTYSNDPKPEKDSFVVVQLFTSQGCSSCPAADMLLEKIKDEYKGKNVYAMSYHVKYWDRLGWKDPFGKRKFTELQYSYAEQFRERSVYTPQIVVNGSEHFVGSDEYKLRNRIASYLKKETKNGIELSTTEDAAGNKVLHYRVSGETNNRQLKLAFILDNQITRVRRGENSNRTLSNSNIVLDEIALKLDIKREGKFTIPKKTLKRKGKISLIGFVQNDQLKISGATRLDL